MDSFHLIKYISDSFTKLCLNIIIFYYNCKNLYLYISSSRFSKNWSYDTAAGKDAAGHAITWKATATTLATPTEGSQAVHTLAAHSKIVKGVSYDSALAALGFTFMISIFSALGTTVAFKFLERKRGAK